MKPQLTTALSTVVSLLFIWVSYFIIYRRARLDHYRQSLFDARNEAWEYALRNDLLNSSAHRGLRELLNGLIKLAPITNLFVWIPLLLLAPKGDRPPLLIKEIAALPSDRDREVLMHLRMKAVYLSMVYLLGPAYFIHAMFDEDCRIVHFMRRAVIDADKVEERVEFQARNAAKNPRLYAGAWAPLKQKAA